MDASLFLKKAHADAELTTFLRSSLRDLNLDDEMVETTMARLQPILLAMADVSVNAARGDMGAVIHQMQTNSTVLAGHLTLAIVEAESWKRRARALGSGD